MLPASRKEVFDAWLDAARMREWMCPGAMTSSDVTLAPRVGGRFRIVTRGPEGQVVNTFIDSPALSEGAFGAATRKGRGPR